MTPTNARKLPVLALAAALLATSFGATGCSSTNTQEDRTSERVGQVVGGVLGALAGSQISQGSGRAVAVGVGVLAGVLIGGELGRGLDERDRLLARQAEQGAYDAPVNQTVSWNNPDSGNSGTVTPTREGTNNQTGEYCREFETTVTVDGQLERATGTACKQPDGTWRIVQ